MSFDFTRWIRRDTQEPIARFRVTHSVTVTDLCWMACRMASATCVNEWDMDGELTDDVRAFLPESKSQLEDETRSTYAAFGSDDSSGEFPNLTAWGIMQDRIEEWYGLRPKDWNTIG